MEPVRRYLRQLAWAQLAPQEPDAPGGGLASMLDRNGNGNPLDDIIGMAGRLKR